MHFVLRHSASARPASSEAGGHADGDPTSHSACLDSHSVRRSTGSSAVTCLRCDPLAETCQQRTPDRFLDGSTFTPPVRVDQFPNPVQVALRDSHGQGPQSPRIAHGCSCWSCRFLSWAVALCHRRPRTRRGGRSTANCHGLEPCRMILSSGISVNAAFARGLPTRTTVRCVRVSVGTTPWQALERRTENLFSRLTSTGSLAIP
jgi:hypothetical protein